MLLPGQADVEIGLGIIRQEQDQLDEAAACYSRAITLRCGAPDAHNNLGTVLRRQGWPHDAAACYRQALALNPGCEAWLNLAALLSEQDRLKRGDLLPQSA